MSKKKDKPSRAAISYFKKVKNTKTKHISELRKLMNEHYEHSSIQDVRNVYIDMLVTYESSKVKLNGLSYLAVLLAAIGLLASYLNNPVVLAIYMIFIVIIAMIVFIPSVSGYKDYITILEVLNDIITEKEKTLNSIQCNVTHPSHHNTIKPSQKKIRGKKSNKN